MSGFVMLVIEVYAHLLHTHTHTHKKFSKDGKNTKLVMQPAGQDVKVIV